MTALEKAAAFEREEGAVQVVGMNGFGYLNPDSHERYLFTAMTNVCAGLALVSTGNRHHGLMHVFSDNSMYRHGEEKLKSHAKEFWQHSMTRLPRDIMFTATAFGGNTSYVDKMESLPEEQTDLFMTMRYMEEQFKEISGASPFYYQLNPDYRINHKFKAAEAFLQQHGIDFECLISHLSSDQYKKSGNQMSAAVSTWIGDGLYEAALASGRISEMEDLRYHEAPHDAVIDSETGETFVGRFFADKLSTKMNPASNERRRSAEKFLPPHHIFESLDL